MKTKEIKQKSEKELQGLLQENREKLRQFRFALASGKLKNIREIRQIKKEIARILTISTNISRSDLDIFVDS